MTTRILTGIQPSGTAHIGNYFGMMRRAIALQDDPLGLDCFYFIADYHALTSVREGARLAEHTREVVLDWLALGIDPTVSTFYRQSDVPEHAEAMWLMLCLTPMGLLERAHSYKDKKTRGLDANAGLLTYPVLMAVDILLYGAHRVPVGKDQKQHVEMARDLALKFHHYYGEIFTLPEADIAEEVMTVPGTDGQKMSKSYGNTINIFEEEKRLKKKIMGLPTQSIELGDPIDPETCAVMGFHRLFATPNLVEIENRYREGKIGFGESKKLLLSRVWEYFAPARERRAELAQNPDLVADILATGAAKARPIAQQKLAEMRELVGLSSLGELRAGRSSLPAASLTAPLPR